ncbi:MAG: hypothetical protein EXR72_04085 [Myxococcales bacterium]|nr:hypothetical protein [Myxococcales bacterium]
MRCATRLLTLALLFGGAPAFAEPEVVKPAPPKPLGPLVVGARVGGSFPGAFNKLGSTFLVELELGWQLPFLGRRLGIFGEVSYTQPGASGTRSDPRLASGMASWQLTERDLGLTVGAKFQQPIGQWILLYGGVGAKVHLTRHIVTATSGGADLGENSEDSTRLGLLLRLGGGLRLGPGAVVIELQYEYTPVHHLITGDDNTASLAAALGYTLFLL